MGDIVRCGAFDLSCRRWRGSRCRRVERRPDKENICDFAATSSRPAASYGARTTYIARRNAAVPNVASKSSGIHGRFGAFIMATASQVQANYLMSARRIARAGATGQEPPAPAKLGSFGARTVPADGMAQHSTIPHRPECAGGGAIVPNEPNFSGKEAAADRREPRVRPTTLSRSGIGTGPPNWVRLAQKHRMELRDAGWSTTRVPTCRDYEGGAGQTGMRNEPNFRNEERCGGAGGSVAHRQQPWGRSATGRAARIGFVWRGGMERQGSHGRAGIRACTHPCLAVDWIVRRVLASCDTADR